MLLHVVILALQIAVSLRGDEIFIRLAHVTKPFYHVVLLVLLQRVVTAVEIVDLMDGGGGLAPCIETRSTCDQPPLQIPTIS